MATEEQHPDTAHESRVPQYTDHDPYGHGHSTAAWTAVGVVMLGFLIMSIAVVITTLWLFIVGAVVTAVGGVLGKVLGGMGLGAKQPSVH